MPEHAHDSRGASTSELRTPRVQDWDSWPFTGGVEPKPLRDPEPEPDRNGEGARACEACDKPDAEYIWTSTNWRLHAFPRSGLPFVAILEPREHVDGPRDLSDTMLAEMGVMLARVERAVLTIQSIERVHILRYGEGAAHLHWWFMARPTGLRQLASGFAMIWDDVLPTTPEAAWNANVAIVANAMNTGGA